MSKVKYESSYGAVRKITAAQKLAEVACERMAARSNRSLLVRFWNNPEWSTMYHTQLRFANGLLKIYDETLVIRTFLNLPNVWSLGAKFFADILQREENTYMSEIKRAEVSVPIEMNDTQVIPRTTKVRGMSARAKIKMLDEQKKI